MPPKQKLYQLVQITMVQFFFQQALGLLRELLVIIRAWGKVSNACLPVFMTTQTLDPLPLLFRLTTKAWKDARDNTNVEADQSFMDECCNLPSKVRNHKIIFF